MSEKEKENWLMVSKKELEENSEDHGSMFCEDCHRWHPISYSQAFEDGDGSLKRMLVGFYECNGKFELWSINGRRVD